MLGSPDVHAKVHYSEYLAKTVSDHNPLLIHLRWFQERPVIPTWRLRPEALEDPVFCTDIKTGITQYFQEKEGTPTSPIAEWEAFKLVLWGLCIAKMVGVRKTLLNEVEAAEVKLRSAEKESYENRGTQEKVLEAREALAVQMETLRSFDYKKYVAGVHAEGDKTGSLLAWLANPNARGTPILGLKTPIISPPCSVE